MCTGEPYVVCDQETYDDEIIVFFDSQAAVEEAKEQTEAGTPVRPMKLENKQFLIFYTSLYTLGVNALLVKDGGRNSLIQLQDFVKRNKPVSYTHLDVYKRQVLRNGPGSIPQATWMWIYSENNIIRARYENKLDTKKQRGCRTLRVQPLCLCVSSQPSQRNMMVSSCRISMGCLLYTSRCV